jgi:hypothetical protein
MCSVRDSRAGNDESCNMSCFVVSAEMQTGIQSSHHQLWTPSPNPRKLHEKPAQSRVPDVVRKLDSHKSRLAISSHVVFLWYLSRSHSLLRYFDPFPAHRPCYRLPGCWAQQTWQALSSGSCMCSTQPERIDVQAKPNSMLGYNKSESYDTVGSEATAYRVPPQRPLPTADLLHASRRPMLPKQIQLQNRMLQIHTPVSSVSWLVIPPKG